MEATTRNRAELKSYFVKNSIPTEGQFAELIEGMLNQSDDGFVKLPDEPLSIAATGDAAGEKKALHFYRDFADPAPDWTLNLNPASGPGLNISDGDGNSRLFIDRNSGNIGIGTTEPEAQLDIQTKARNGTHAAAGKVFYITGDFKPYSDGVEFRHTNGGQGIGFGYNTIYATGSQEDQDLGLKPRGSGVIEVKGPLHVTGAITPATGDSESAGIMFPKDPGGGSGDAAWIRYHPRESEHTTLEIGISNDPQDHIALMPSGHVGIGTIRPGAMLEVVANSSTAGGWKEAIRFGHPEHSAITHPGGGLLFGLHSNRHFYFTDIKDGEFQKDVMQINADSGDVTVMGNIELQVDNADSRIRFHDPNNFWYSMGIDQSDGGKFKINYGGNVGEKNHFALTVDGKVGIGTAEPGSKAIDGVYPILDVKGYASFNGLRIGQDGYNAILSDNVAGLTLTCVSDDPRAKIDFKTGGNSEKNIRLRITSGGNVGIGTTSVPHDLTIPRGGTFYSHGRMHIHGEEHLYLLNKKGVIIGKEWGGNGNLVVQGEIYGSGVVKPSDIRLKEDIEPVANALDRVLALRGVNFTLRNGDHGRGIGLIAQEVEEVFPEAVKDGPDGIKGIDYTNLIAPLVEAIKAQQAEIENLRRDLARLTAE